MNTPHHKGLAEGRWLGLTLAEQMGNIGSEVHRAAEWQERDQNVFDQAVDNALELFDLTMRDVRWRERLKEIARAREFFCEAALGEKIYGSLREIDDYFLAFAVAARNAL